MASNLYALFVESFMAPWSISIFMILIKDQNMLFTKKEAKTKI